MATGGVLPDYLIWKQAEVRTLVVFGACVLLLSQLQLHLQAGGTFR
jgi:hypothetical protein